MSFCCTTVNRRHSSWQIIRIENRHIWMAFKSRGLFLVRLYSRRLLYCFFKSFLTAIVLFMLCPLATYGRSHDKSSLFVWWVGNQTSTKKLLHKWCFAERLKIVFCCIYSVGFPIFQYVCSRWDFGNMEMSQLTSFSASQCHHVIGGSRF